MHGKATAVNDGQRGERADGSSTHGELRSARYAARIAVSLQSYLISSLCVISRLRGAGKRGRASGERRSEGWMGWLQAVAALLSGLVLTLPSAAVSPLSLATLTPTQILIGGGRTSWGTDRYQTYTTRQAVQEIALVCRSRPRGEGGWQRQPPSLNRLGDEIRCIPARLRDDFLPCRAAERPSRRFARRRGLVDVVEKQSRGRREACSFLWRDQPADQSSSSEFWAVHTHPKRT